MAKKTTAHKTLMSLKEHTRKGLEIKFRNEKRLCESLRETETEVTVVDENEVEGSDKENEQEEQTEPVNVVEQTDEEDSESERESEMSSSECEMSEEETFRSINRIIEYEIEYVTV